MKILLVLPSYNEKENIENILMELLKQPCSLDILVVDDNSPDNTAQIVKNIQVRESRVFLIERSAKLGLGSAYLTGFKWGLQKEYDYFFAMDADLSHNPNDISRFIEEIEKGFDLVVGSRYLKGTISVVGWDFRRLLLSKFANWYATKILGIKRYTDVTSGYRVYSRKALEKINLESIKSNGYAFQIEMVYKIHKAGLKITEIPIIFYERENGSSKMSKEIALEAAIMVWKLRLWR